MLFQSPASDIRALNGAQCTDDNHGHHTPDTWSPIHRHGPKIYPNTCHKSYVIM